MFYGNSSLCSWNDKFVKSLENLCVPSNWMLLAKPYLFKKFKKNNFWINYFDNIMWNKRTQRRNIPYCRLLWILVKIACFQYNLYNWLQLTSISILITLSMKLWIMTVRYIRLLSDPRFEAAFTNKLYLFIFKTNTLTSTNQFCNR